MDAVQQTQQGVAGMNMSEDTPQTILLAVDASEQAENAINWYCDHVHRRGNRLVFVHCIELPEMKSSSQARSLHMSPGVLAAMWQEEEEKTKKLEEKVKELLKSKGLSGTLRTTSGKPGPRIVEIAEEEGACLIVTGSRGMGKVRRTILGSVSDYLVHHASCPVIVCRYRRPSGSRSRNASGESQKSRHGSGDSTSIFAKFRHRSGDKSSRQMSTESNTSQNSFRQMSTESNTSQNDKSRSFSVGSENDQ